MANELENNMKKKLKKVDENKKVIQAAINSKLEVLSTAYKNKDGLAIDNAIEDFLTYLENSLSKDHTFYTQIKNHTWQRNHLRILGSVSDLMQKNNCMPTNTQIANEAGLSEETVYKHLREFKEHDLYKHEADKYRLLIHRVLSTVFNIGVQGDIRACKVYLDYFNSNNNLLDPTFKQTNYIKINNLKITATDLEQLPSTTLQKIENLIKLPLKKKLIAN
ncbi:hypothetical protein [Ferruginibacter profundus]